MIITRTPLRVSFVGGGSDVPWFHQEEPGRVVAAAIDKYVYVTYSPKYDGTFRAAYMQMENETQLSRIRHELIRETFALYNKGVQGLEVHSIADLPGGTGLGSSSSFTVGLVKALYPNVLPRYLAELAAQIELGRCRKPIGLQDQYIAAHGGFNQYEFLTGRETIVTPVTCADNDAFLSHCLLLDTGLRRNEAEDAGSILQAQKQDRELIRGLVGMVEPFVTAIQAGSYQMAGVVLDAAWHVKRHFLGLDMMDDWYRQAKWEGAWGGKLCGAGGGGFLLFMAPPDAHSRIISTLGLRHVPFRIGVEGSQVIYHD